MEVAPDGSPVRFTWRGATYPVLEVLSTWHLMSRWWVSPVGYALGRERLPASDRTYYRVRAPEQQIFEVYYDAVGHAWVPDVVQD